MSGTDGPLLAVRGLAVAYGKSRVVHGVDFEVAATGVTTLIGSNGAGKTTIMKALTGLVPTDAGSVRLGGDDITGLRPDEITRRGVALVPEGRRLFASMTVLENLRIGAWLRPQPAAVARALDEVLDHFPELAAKLDTKVTLLSGGQQQMVAFGRALMAAPRLLLMDEPTIGLAPIVVQRIVDLARGIAARGVGVLLVEQNASIALKNSERAYVLENGSITMQGASKELAVDDNVRRAYLGM